MFFDEAWCTLGIGISPDADTFASELTAMGLGFLRRGARYVSKWETIPDVESVALGEGGQLIVSFGLPPTWCQVRREMCTYFQRLQCCIG